MQYLVIRIPVDDTVDAERLVATAILHSAGQSVRPTVSEHGDLVFELGDDFEVSEPVLRVGESQYELDTEQFLSYRDPDFRHAVVWPLEGPLAGPSTGVPSGSRGITRLMPGDAKGVDVPPLAGTPATAMPVNGVASRETRTYLNPIEELRVQSDWVPGFLLEFQTTWEPLGWALDEWVDTVSLAPFEDSMRSDTDLANDASAQADAHTAGEDNSRFNTDGSAGVHESTRISSESSSAGKGFQAGFGGSSATNSALTLDPIASITKAITGSVQLGYSSNKFASNALASGDLKREVQNHLEQATSLERKLNARSVAASVGRLRESRRLRALRNLAGGKALNLAVFSVTRQWLVTTFQERVRSIVFLRVQDLEVDFTREDVFLRRAALSEVLLDPSLGSVLEEVAAQYVPDGTSVDVAPVKDDLPQPEIRTIHGRARVDDPAKGRGSVVRVEAIFRDPGGGDDVALPAEFSAARADELATFTIEANRALADLVGWRFQFHNPGFKGDELASLRSVQVELETEGPEKHLVAVGLPRRIEISVWRATEYGPFVEQVEPPAKPSSYQEANISRLLAHLNANRAHYRLGLDLLQDPVSRFAKLSERAGSRSMPSDMQPVGVAGTHLAFLWDSPMTSSGDETQPVTQLLSTPAGGTFMEIMAGQNLVEAATNTDKWPSVVVADGGSLTWPTPVSMASLATPTVALEKGVTPSGAAPDQGASELTEKLSAAIGAIEKLTAAVDAQAAKTKEAVPKADAASASVGSGEAPKEEEKAGGH